MKFASLTSLSDANFIDSEKFAILFFAAILSMFFYRSYLSRLLSTIKFSIFNFFYSLIDGDDIFPAFLKFVFVFIETMQIIHFAFATGVNKNYFL